MEKFFILSLCLLSTVAVYAQKYAPTTTWPFLYEDFQDGTVYFSDNGRTKEQKLNIHLENVTLWHQDGGNILHSNASGISKVMIGSDTFIYMNGQLARLIRAEGESALAELVKVDFKALVSTSSGAYGMSTQTASTHNQTSISGIGGHTHLIHEQAKTQKNEGTLLPLIRKYYFIVGDKIIQASRKEVEKSVSKETLPMLRNFVKENKIKWDNEESLSLLLNILR
ncbi:hypothetical protein FACS1894181_08500 [Bacteroidia bacterium]|nr:hypothetical protein FACS1894181_08500 [Bacteroidia bacterium]